MIRRCAVLASLVFAIPLGNGVSFAEPMFISKQYTRCVSCHFSPTGGGLLSVLFERR